MPEPTPSPAPSPAPTPAPTPAPAAPTPPAPAPTNTPPSNIAPSGNAFEHALRQAFPDGVIPSAQPVIGLQPQAPQFGGQPPTPIITGPPGVTGPGLTGATGPAATGATGATGPAASGATGASGPAASGPSGPPTKEQLDAAEKAMALPAGTAFKIVRAENADLTKKLAAETEKRQAAEQKAAEAGTEAKANAELKAKLDGYEKKLAVVDIEATENYQKTIAKPLKAAEASLTQLATKYEVPISELRAALAEPDLGKRSDALSELSAKFNRLDTIAFDRTVLDITTLEQAREQALASAAEQLAAVKAAQLKAAADSAKAFEKDWEVSRDKALEELVADKTAVGVIFTPTGDEKFDADVAASIEQVKSLDVTKMTNQQIAQEFFRSRALPLATRLISTQFSRIEVLEAEIAQLRGGTPPQGGGNPPQPTPSTAVPPGASFRDVAKQALQGVLPP